MQGFSQTVFRLGQSKPAGTEDTVSSKQHHPEKTNSLSRPQARQAKEKKSHPTHCLQTHLLFPPCVTPWTDIFSDQRLCFGLLLILNYLISKLTTGLISTN